MTGWVYTKNIRNQNSLRKSFNQLATETFGISFEDWYNRGFWTEKYEPNVFLDGDKVIANVSVNKLSLLINGEVKKAIQIGTVMTHLDYRNKGLSAHLMNKVLEEYENKVDIFYLFANSSVLNFYPKFGFKPINEYQFMMDFTCKKENPQEGIHQLNGKNERDLKFIYEFALNRLPVSTRFGTMDTQELLMFYCMYVFPEHIYYLEQEDAIVLFNHDNKELHIFDIVSKTGNGIENILKKLSSSETEKVVFHYTPDYDGVNVGTSHHRGSEVLFVKSNLILPDSFKHPLTSQA